MIYVIEYICILLLGIIFVVIPSKTAKYERYKKIFFLIISYVILSLTLGLRASSVGEDTQSYLTIAEAARNLSWEQVLGGFPRTTWNVIKYTDTLKHEEKIETFYLIFCKLIMLITNNALAVQIICAILTCFFFFKFIFDNSEDLVMSIMGFIGESLFISAFNLQRQMLAMSIGVNSYTEIKEKRYGKALIYIIVASCIHVSALSYLLLIPISFFKKFQMGMCFGLILVICYHVFYKLLIWFVRTFLPMFAAYTEASYWNIGVGKTAIVWLIEITIIVFLILKKGNNKDEYMCSLLTCIYISIELMGLSLAGFGRVALYYRPFVILLFPTILKYIERKEIKIIYYFIIICMFAFQLWSAGRLESRAYQLFFVQ